MRKLKYLSAALLTSLMVLMGGNSLSYGESSVDQLIIINSARNTLNFYEKGSLVRAFRCATGTGYTPTPQAKTTVANKIENRPYYKTGIPGGSPNNPLGPRWIGLFSGQVYAIHGTNAPGSIGTNASHGCIRMHNEEVKWLYDKINVGATVIIKNSALSDEEIAKDHGVLIGYKWQTKGDDKYFTNGSENVTGWNDIEGKKYYFNNEGKLQTGLQTIDNNIYYLGKDGVIQTGWQEVNKNKYFFTLKGKNMGQAVKGKTTIEDKVYYFNEDGTMASNQRVKIGENYYGFGENGVMITSKKVDLDDETYYFGEDGVMVSNKLVTIDDNGYYFDEDGSMAKFTIKKVNGGYCYFRSNGKMVENIILKAGVLVVALAGIIIYTISRRRKPSKENKPEVLTNV